MTDTKTIVRILAAVRVEQGRPVFNVSTVSEQVLRTDEATRDRLALMLQKEGYIDGLYIIDGIDNVALDYAFVQHVVEKAERYGYKRCL